MTTYTMIDTTDLMKRWDLFGADTSLVVYMDKPHQILSISQDKRNVHVVTTRDTFLIPRGDKSIKMWRVLD